MRSTFTALVTGLVLSAVTSSTYPIDPPIAQGMLEYGGQRYELRYAQAVRTPDEPKRIWVLLSTVELTVKDAVDPARALELAMSGRLRGVRLVVDSAALRPDQLKGILLLSKAESPTGEIAFAAGTRNYWERLTIGDNRIVGTVRYALKASPGSPPDWGFQASFSAPIFNAR